MIFVALKISKKILNRCDAWEQDGVERMTDFARENGYKVLGQEITTMGDMIIWVE